MKTSKLIFTIIGIILALLVLSLGITQCFLQELTVGKVNTTESGSLEDEVNSFEQITVLEIGIFQSTYDPSELNEQQLMASFLPNAEVEGDSSTFDFLFPTRKNYVLNYLPTSLGTFSTLGALNVSAIEHLEEPSINVSQVEFESCGEYVDVMQHELISYFDAMDIVLSVFSEVNYGSKTGFGLQKTLRNTHAKLTSVEDSPFGSMFLSRILDAAVAGDQVTVDCTSFISDIQSKTNLSEVLSIVLTSSDTTCLSDGYGELNEFDSLRDIYSEFSCTGDTIETCLMENNGGSLVEVTNQLLSDRASFLGANLCEQPFYSCSNIIAYLELAASILQESSTDDVVIYGKEIQLYADTMQLVSQETGNSADVEDILIASEPFSELLDKMNQFYSLCRDIEGMLDKVYGTSLKADFIAFLASEEILEKGFARLADGCLHDELDSDKFIQAQNLLSIAVILYALVVIIFLCGALYSRRANILLIVGAFMEAVAGSLNIYSILTLQNTDLYHKIGLTEFLNEVSYEKGIIPQLSHLCFVLALILSLFILLLSFFEVYSTEEILQEKNEKTDDLEVESRDEESNWHKSNFDK
eukprot:snap_masked-scaffold_31-processed-gene-2.31-mRNA-1 protein AED:1.00 eAED:1.00 QI:0/0/0/0/1/1/2/0/584